MLQSRTSGSRFLPLLDGWAPEHRFIWIRAADLGGLCDAKYFLDQGFVKYEDFVSDRDGTAEKMCKALNMKFDPTYKDRFDGYKNITGDSAASGKTSYRSASRVINSTLFGQLKAEPDYTALCDLLGYDPESVPYGYTIS